MADKKRKRPKHTNLFVPGDKGKKDKKAKKGRDERDAADRDRLGRTVDEVALKAPAEKPEGEPAEPAGAAAAGQNAEAADPAQAPPEKAGPEKPTEKQAGAKKKNGLFGRGKKKPAAEEEPLPPNAVRMPRRKPRLSPARRKRRRRRIGALLLALLVAAGIFFFTSGAYLTVATLVSDAYDGLRLAARPGDGFPISFAMPNYITARGMGKNGFAVLGGREMALISATGLVLRRENHTYLSPGISAGKTRAVVFGRGGNEYVVEGRSKTMARVSTEHEILFCAISPDGWLAEVTNSRYRATLRILGPDYDTADPLYERTILDDKPFMADFHSDNRSLALGCLTFKNGGMGTVIQLIQSNREEYVAEITTYGSTLLALEYLDNYRVLAVYDSHTALYSSRGEEIARYNHGSRRLLGADIYEGHTALVFGTTSQDKMHVVLLSEGLQPLFDITAEGSGTAHVLAGADGVYLLAGQQVSAFHTDGTSGEVMLYEDKAYGLVHGSAPLLITATQVLPLTAFVVSADSSASLSASGSLPQSGSQPQSLPPSDAAADPPPDSLSGPIPNDLPEGDIEPGGPDDPANDPVDDPGAEDGQTP